MDYSLNEDQAALVSAIERIVRDRAELPQSARLGYHYFDEDLQRTLDEQGFLDAGRDLGSLDAALVVIEAAKIPAVVEVAASALISPKLLEGKRAEGPVALVDYASIGKAHRNLSVAKTALVDLGGDVAMMTLDPANVEGVDTIFGYPYGKFRKPPDLKNCRRLGPGSEKILRHWWRVAIAAEMAGAAQSAVEFTLDYVKERHVFGRPIGSFQAVQHRLAQCYQIARGMHFLTLRAAWSETTADADLAACYGQQHIQKLMFDLHQFNGAMGVTTEHLLHFWTYRLRALQSEAGGAYKAALDIADQFWGIASDRRVNRSSVGERGVSDE